MEETKTKTSTLSPRRHRRWPALAILVLIVAMGAQTAVLLRLQADLARQERALRGQSVAIDSAMTDLESLQDEISDLSAFKTDTENFKADVLEYVGEVNAAFGEVYRGINRATSYYAPQLDTPDTLFCTGYSSTSSYQKFTCSE
jgi:hypothetical protein